MRKSLLIILVVLGIAATGIPASAVTYHLFFIDQKETFNVGGTDYQAWHIGPYYLMEADDARPEGYTVHNIIKLLYSQGANDMIYVVVNDRTIAQAALSFSEYAGGGTSYGGAWIDFVVRSYEQAGAHAAFPAGAAARAVLPVRWKSGEEWAAGSLSDWIAAGKPSEGFVNVAIRIYGVE